MSSAIEPPSDDDGPTWWPTMRDDAMPARPIEPPSESPDALFVAPRQGLASDERWTPQWVFDALGETFDTDPASPVGGGDHVPAAVKFTRLEDGLAHPWSGFVWLNPPFSQSTPWADRFRQHGCGVWLGPIANSRWFVDLARSADRLYLCRDIPFVHPLHAGRRSSMPLAFVALGARAVAAVDRLAASDRVAGALVANVRGAA